MKKPVIGITPIHNLENGDIAQRPTYFNAIAAAGAIPLLLPLKGTKEDWAQLVSLCDGFLFSGGPDISPLLYGENTRMHCGNASPARDTMELALFDAAFQAKKPILGICRGIQLINVALGGNLYQDIPSQAERTLPVAHSQPGSFQRPSHYVTVKEGTKLAEILKNHLRLEVNSMHHQAILNPAEGLVINAQADDGIIEGVELPDYPFLLGVQWHPEYLFADDENAAALFSAFVAACH